MLYCCRACDGGPCELRSLAGGDAPPDRCPFGLEIAPPWLAVPSGRSTMPRTGRDLLPEPSCTTPLMVIVATRTGNGGCIIETNGTDRVVLPCSFAALTEGMRVPGAAAGGPVPALSPRRGGDGAGGGRR